MNKGIVITLSILGGLVLLGLAILSVRYYRCRQRQIGTNTSAREIGGSETISYPPPFISTSTTAKEQPCRFFSV